MQSLARLIGLSLKCDMDSGLFLFATHTDMRKAVSKRFVSTGKLGRRRLSWTHVVLGASISGEWVPNAEVEGNSAESRCAFEPLCFPLVIHPDAFDSKSQKVCILACT